MPAGNLQKELKTDPKSLDKKDTEKIPIPEGKTEEEFVEELKAGFNSYDDGIKYEMLPDKAWTGNSNSLVGSVLRQAGSNFEPSREAPGFQREVLPGERVKKPENRTLVGKFLNSSYAKVLFDFGRINK